MTRRVIGTDAPVVSARCPFAVLTTARPAQSMARRARRIRDPRMTVRMSPFLQGDEPNLRSNSSFRRDALPFSLRGRLAASLRANPIRAVVAAVTLPSASESAHEASRRLARDCARAVAEVFDEYHERFRLVARRAARHFRARDWVAVREESTDRLRLYAHSVDHAIAQVVRRARDVERRARALDGDA